MTSKVLEGLPALDEYYTVPEEKVAYYQKNGHVCLRGIATEDEIAPYRDRISEMVAELKKDAPKLADRDTYHKAFLQCSNLWELDEIVKKFVFSRRFGKIAADLMKTDGARLYHDQALFKEPGGGHTPWHQDEVYWPFNTVNTTTMWMPLVDAPVESGTMIFANETQNEGFISHKAISDESADFFRKWVVEHDKELVINDMAAGDATFHGGWTLHKAPGNSTDFVRKVMTIIYYAYGEKIAEGQNPLRPIDMERWFPGQKPGDEAGTHLNPVVYHKDASKMTV